MFFAHDTTYNFYYYGEVEPRPKLYQDLLINTNPKLVGVDVETISLKERIAIGVGISVTPNVSFYFPLFPEPSPVVPWDLLKDPTVAKVFHNALFDLTCMREYEIDTTNIKDTSVMAHLLCYPYAALVDLSVVHQMEVHPVKEFLKEHNATIMLDVPPEAVAKKCMQDSSATLMLYHEFLPEIDQPYFLTEMELIPILIEMSNRGLLIDQEVRAGLEEQLKVEVDYFFSLCDGEGFNPGSPQQVGYILAKRGAYNVFYRLPFTQRGGRGSLSTAKETLLKMDDPLAVIVQNYREKSTLLNNYIKPWANGDRATTRFHLDAITGRITSTDRNLQNIPPGETRGIFLPDSGIWTDVDYSQLELRILAYISGDREMQYIFSLPKFNPDGSINEEADIHQQTAKFMGIVRRIAKNVGFAMIYGATDETMAETAGIRSVDRGRKLKESWFEKFPQAGDWIQAVQGQAINHPRAKTVFGREIRLPNPEEESIGGIMRKAVNYPIQGSAAEILKRGLIICKELPMALQIHDEILFDGFVQLPTGLDSIAPFYTPIDTKYLERWE